MISAQFSEASVQDQSDYLVKALCLDGRIRLYASRTTELTAEGQRRHQTWPVASAALGRTLSVGAMMGAMLKGDEQLTVKINGNGPIGNIIVDANSHGRVRGFVDHPHIHFPLNEQGKLDVGRAVGTDGGVYVTKDLGLKEPYHGHSVLVSGEIGEDFTYYFAQSEQTPSAVSVGVLVNPDQTIKASGGFIVQLLPGVEDHYVTLLEERLQHIPSASQMVDQGYTPERMIEEIMPNESIQWLERIPLHFSCQCSYTKVQNTLVSLGKAELESMLHEDGQAEAVCHFCREAYVFDRQALQQLLAQM